jgi:hypothetical protein
MKHLLTKTFQDLHLIEQESIIKMRAIRGTTISA